MVVSCRNTWESWSITGLERVCCYLLKMAEPFKTKINGWDVTVNAHDSAVLMHDLSLSRFADTILKQEESKEGQEDGELAQSSWPKKKQKTNNNSAMVNTTLGTDGYSALSQTQRHDTECINKQDTNTSKKMTERIKWIKATLTLVTKHKEWCEKDKHLLLAIAPDTIPNCLVSIWCEPNQQRIMHYNVASPGSSSKGAVKIKRHSMQADCTANCTITLQGALWQQGVLLADATCLPESCLWLVENSMERCLKWC